MATTTITLRNTLRATPAMRARAEALRQARHNATIALAESLRRGLSTRAATARAKGKKKLAASLERLTRLHPMALLASQAAHTATRKADLMRPLDMSDHISSTYDHLFVDVGTPDDDEDDEGAQACSSLMDDTPYAMKVEGRIIQVNALQIAERDGREGVDSVDGDPEYAPMIIGDVCPEMGYTATRTANLF